MTELTNRKDSHIQLTEMAQISGQDTRFDYEPLLGQFPSHWSKPRPFLGKKIEAPLWISSMTGGTKKGKALNKIFAAASAHFGLGMGLGSCRVLLEQPSKFEDFNLRPILGNDLPFYANIGIAQVEQLVASGSLEKLFEMVEKLMADGLIVHINPLQEFFQPSGDKINRPPLETLAILCEKSSVNIIVKEVGQGMGPHSLRSLLQLDIKAIELAALGGTNFTKLEGIRAENPLAEDFSKVGHSAYEMIQSLNQFKEKDIEVIISGGINSVLDAYYLQSICEFNSVIGKAGSLLKYAMEGEKVLIANIENWLMNYRLAENFLRVKQ